MRVKRFVGDNVAETMGKVKIELGSNAVILQTRQIREGGIFGFFKKPRIEITAAIEEEHIPKYTPKKEVNPTPPPVFKPNSPSSYDSSIYKGNSTSHKDDLITDKDHSIILEDHASSKERYQSLSPSSTSKPASIEMEIQSMRQMLEKMNHQMEGLDGKQSVWPVPLQKWADILEQRGVNNRVVKKILRQVQLQIPEDEWANDQKVGRSLKSYIMEKCQNTGLILPGNHRPTVISLIGPTGVGKTTTIGKLAASFNIIDKRSVALITVDTYRVAAVDQLKTFGEIIGLPVEVVNKPSELERVIQDHADKEMIFIDTAGRSPQHELHMSELRAYLDKAQPDYTMLVISATTHSTDQLEILERFKAFTSHIIYTKLDETVNGGAILNLIEEVDLPIAYIANGQSVPDDIEKATPENLTRYILGEVNF